MLPQPINFGRASSSQIITLNNTKQYIAQKRLGVMCTMELAHLHLAKG